MANGSDHYNIKVKVDGEEREYTIHFWGTSFSDGIGRSVEALDTAIDIGAKVKFLVGEHSRDKFSNDRIGDLSNNFDIEVLIPAKTSGSNAEKD